MPSTREILAGLTAIANDAAVFAVVWHQLTAIMLVGIVGGWRPRRRVAIALLAAPLVSVAGFAIAYSNPFNAVVFGGAALVLLVIAARGDDQRVAPGPTWAIAAGAALIGFAWIYPHFLATSSWVVYLYASPMGLVPCPSLALAIGAALLAGGVDRRVALALAIVGLGYGLIGVARFGVTLDVGLLVGAAALLALALHPTVRGAARPVLHHRPWTRSAT
jgi:hypothetical protein